MAESDPKADVPPADPAGAAAAQLPKCAVSGPLDSGIQPARFRSYYWLGLAVVAIVFVLQTALTWRKWPDILIDFGIQLYIPWRIVNGAVLYRDLFYFAGGPFSQYFNALLFKLFGVSFSTLIAANLVFAAALILVVYRKFLAATDAWTATVIATAIIIIFAFAEYTPIGNYNYIAPYSHEATHGLIISIFSIALLANWLMKGKNCHIAMAGFCTGIVFLTKPDIFVALAVPVAAAFVLRRIIQPGTSQFGRPLIIFFAAATSAPLFFLIYFLRAENLRDSLGSIVFGWLPLIHGTVTKNLYYRWCTGLDAPLAHLKEIILYFFAVTVAVAVYAFAMWCTGRLKLRSQAQCIVAVVLVAPLLVWLSTFDWRNCGWPLPLLSLSTCLAIAFNFKQLDKPVFPMLWSIFGFVLLSKLGLFPRVWHYGFALAMPAFVSSIYLLFWLLPRLLEMKFAAPALPFRLIVGLVLAIGFANLFHQSQLIYAQKSLPLGTAGDTIMTYNATSEVSQAVYAAMLWTEKYMPRNATLAVLPEGVTINYLTRHVNPTPCLDWNPTMFTVFGQTPMTNAVEKHPPDFIFIVECSSAQFGVGYFGSSPDYGQGLMQWIQKNYKTELLIGHEPLKNGQFGIKILKFDGSTPQQSTSAARPGPAIPAI